MSWGYTTKSQQAKTGGVDFIRSVMGSHWRVLSSRRTGSSLLLKIVVVGVREKTVKL